MFIRIETTSGLPISRQIADQIRARYARGSLKPGQRLPSVRELSASLGVNLNTIQRVYERLAAEGLLEQRQGEGTFVTLTPRAKPLRQAREQLERRAQDLVRYARLLGLEEADVRRMVDQALRRTGREDEEVAQKKGTSP